MEKKENQNFIHQPHDKLIKRMLSSPDTARDILSLYLPEEILSIVDLSNLELQPNTFIDAEHRTNAVDLLYKTTFHKEQGYIWILLEHQRKSDYWMPARIFKYIGVIWEHVRRNTKAKNIPFIYPMIIYNGDQPYHHSLNLSELIQPESTREMFSTLFTKPFHLIDLSIIPDESLKNAAREKIRGITLLMSLKHAFDRNFQSYFEESLVFYLQQLDIAGDPDGVTDIMAYLLEVVSLGNKEKILLNFKMLKFSKKVEDKMSTMAEFFMEKGRQEAMLKLATKLLNAEGLNKHPELIELLQDATGMPIDALKAKILET